MLQAPWLVVPSNGCDLPPQMMIISSTEGFELLITYFPNILYTSNVSLIIHHCIKTSSLRANDHATIGGLLFAVLTPAIFWKKAGIAHRT